MPLFALIPGLPLAAFAILALGGRRLGDASHRVGIPAVALSFALSVAALVEVARNGAISIPLYSFLNVGDFVVAVGLYADQLTVLLLPLITGVSFVVHVYSARYMTGDPRYRKFFAVMGLFTFAMTMLVMSDNLLVTYMCWEVMGICSYLLISHWAQRPEAGRAATKAFLVNAVTDVGLGFGVVLAFATYGTLNIQEILAQAPAMQGQTLGAFGFEIERNTLIALCLLSGAIGKSAQVPMHVWLPYAMEAPTPVSALIHAATMVNAGPFLLARLSPLVLLAPTAMAAVAAVGAITALYGALVSLTQTDIKKLLAYSTISQIGFMIFACGVGAFGAAIFHLLAHGFLKAYLFLSTGDSLRATGGHAHSEGSVPSGRARPLAAGALLLACVPPLVLFSGPYGQLWNSQHIPSARVAFWAVAVGAVFLTAVYAFRGVFALFGEAVGKSVRARPRLFSPAHLPGLAVCGIAVTALLAAVWSEFSEFVQPALGSYPAENETADPTLALLVALGVAFLGWCFAYYCHFRPAAVPLGRREWVKTAYVLFLNKLYFDEIHRVLAINPTLRISRWLLHQVDERIVNRTVHEVGTAVRGGARVLDESAESGVIDPAVSGVAHFVTGVATWLEKLTETGLVTRGPRAAASLLVTISGWLWHVVDQQGADESIRRVGGLAEDTGEALQRLGPRTLRHHLVIIVCWLSLAIGLTYLLAN